MTACVVVADVGLGGTDVGVGGTGVAVGNVGVGAAVGTGVGAGSEPHAANASAKAPSSHMAVTRRIDEFNQLS